MFPDRLHYTIYGTLISIKFALTAPFSVQATAMYIYFPDNFNFLSKC
jgi:hypothetical protein